MRLSRKLFAKCVAALLPSGLIMSFGTCFWLCAEQIKPTQGKTLTYENISMMDDACSGDECPMISSRGVLPGKYVPSHTPPQMHAVLNPALEETRIERSRSRDLLSPSASDPPLERLCMLRI